MLSHPLLVEAIESEFVPCCIYNNKKGKDAEVLERYQELAWNNPVVRFVDAAGKDVIARKDRVWSLGGIASRMTMALEASRKKKKKEKRQNSVPLYLRLLATGSKKQGKKKATFAMHCFWEGEAHLGVLPGVTATRAGWLDRKEVVEVCYDEDQVSYEELVKTAKKMKCASTVFAHDQGQLGVARKLVGKNAVLAKQPAKDAKLSDRLYHLRKSVWNAMPATPIQRMRMNSALAKRKDPLQFLSPRQRGVAKLVQKADAKKLAGVEPPADAYGLAAYENKLRKLIAPKPR